MIKISAQSKVNVRCRICIREHQHFWRKNDLSAGEEKTIGIGIDGFNLIYRVFATSECDSLQFNLNFIQQELGTQHRE